MFSTGTTGTKNRQLGPLECCKLIPVFVLFWIYQHIKHNNNLQLCSHGVKQHYISKYGSSAFQIPIKPQNKWCLKPTKSKPSKDVHILLHLSSTPINHRQFPSNCHVYFSAEDFQDLASQVSFSAIHGLLKAVQGF